MPCGGIYPIVDGPHHGRCFHCNQDDPEPMLFCMEWDAFLHASCVLEFLSTPDGQVVVDHTHDIHIVFGLHREEMGDVFDDPKFSEVSESPHLCGTCGHDTVEIFEVPNVYSGCYICCGCKREETVCTCDPKDVVGFSPEEYWAAIGNADEEDRMHPYGFDESAEGGTIDPDGFPVPTGEE